MLENEPTNTSDSNNSTSDGPPAGGAAPRRKRTSAKKTASAPVAAPATRTRAAKTAAPTAESANAAPAATAAPARGGRRPAKKTAAAPETTRDAQPATEPAAATAKKAAKRAPRKSAKSAAGTDQQGEHGGAAETPSRPAAIPTLLFQPPSAENAVPANNSSSNSASNAASAGDGAGAARDSADGGSGDSSGAPRRRRRGGRGRRGGSSSQGQGEFTSSGSDTDRDPAESGEARTDGRSDARSDGDGDGASASGSRDNDEDGRDDHDGEGSASSRRRRRRRSRGAGEGEVRSPDDPPNTVVRIREPREHEDGGGNNSGVQGVKGSTRLEAKKQRRREGREQGRGHGRRGLVITESEFLARRESVDRIMAVRQRGDRTQIGVLEDGILVEHFVSTASTNRMVGNVYLGRVQNVLSGMEAAFVDIGKGRNAVLYAGEVNFDTSGLEGGPRRIESALKPGQAVVVQVTKDPIGQKGARLTSQISLPGRYLVYVPEGSMMGISRKLPDVERSRLKAILKKVTPEGAGVIVRTAAEGASEEDLTRDVARLAAQWEVIQKKSETANAPALLYSEPDLTIRVIRDVFNEDFNQLIVSADSDWDTVEAYVAHVAPDLVPRLSQWTSEEDIFTHYRVDEQIAKALDRKVWLPSGGYLVIDRTEAMIVIDVNTGRFIGKGGNLEETVTKNNLEAAEEIVRQLRLRDIGGIIVIDFIDMVLEGNRDLVLRRLVECLGRDRTKHQVAEVTSLGLVQMTRKRVGNGLLEAFSEVCEVCNGRGVIVHTDLVEHNHSSRQAPISKPTPAVVAAARGKGSRGRGGQGAAARSASEGDAAVSEQTTDATPGGSGSGEVDHVHLDADHANAEHQHSDGGDHTHADDASSDHASSDHASSDHANADHGDDDDGNADHAASEDASAPAVKKSPGASRSRRGGRRRGGSKANAGADHTAAANDSGPAGA
jgi:ribonuclease E